MTSRRFAGVTVSLALALGTLAFGGSSALAAGKGVGPSAGTTGTARACQVHAANNGKSIAKGLNCTPTPPPTAAAFTVVVNASATDPGVCDFTLRGRGLAPGATIIIEFGAGPQAFGVVAADGTYRRVGQPANDGALYAFTAPKAGGGTIVVTTASAC